LARPRARPGRPDRVRLAPGVRGRRARRRRARRARRARPARRRGPRARRRPRRRAREPAGACARGRAHAGPRRQACREGEGDGDGEDDTDIVEQPDRKGELVEVAFELTGISKIDPVKETFEVEGVVSFHSKKSVPKCDKGKIGKLFDGEAKRADMLDEHKEKGALFRQCKVGVEIVGDVNVRRYPFDKQELKFEIYDRSDAMDGVEYHALKEQSGVYENVRLPGWEVQSFSAETKKEKEEGTKAEVTKAEFTVEVARPFFASFVKGLLAVIFQLMVTLIAVLLRAKAVTNRITMVTGALLAIAATHNTVSSSLGVAYLTTADKFFLSCYFSLLVNVAFSVAMLRADDAKQEARVEKLYKTALIVVPLLTILGMVVALLPIG
jgi:hypothetical protein